MAKIIPICLIILQDYLGLKIKNFADVCIGDNSRWYGDLALYFAECATDFTMSYGDIVLFSTLIYAPLFTLSYGSKV